MIQCSQDLYRDTCVDVSSSSWLVMPALVCCVDDWPASLPELSHKCLRNMRLPLYRGCVNRVEWCVEIGEHVFFLKSLQCYRLFWLFCLLLASSFSKMLTLYTSTQSCKKCYTTTGN